MQVWHGTQNLVYHIIKGENTLTDKLAQSERPAMFFLSIVVFLVMVQGQFE